MLVKEIKKQIIENQKADRSQWAKGVSVLSYDIIEYFDDDKNITSDDIKNNVLLNGAHNWYHASWGGNFYIYNEDIAELLCTPSELKRNKHGERRPNSHEEWLDTQARALGQASRRIACIVRNG